VRLSLYISNLLDTEPIRYCTCQILNFSDSKLYTGIFAGERERGPGWTLFDPNLATGHTRRGWWSLRAGRGEGPAGVALWEGLAVIMNWEEERGLGLSA
jgi:hypothetical protein